MACVMNYSCFKSTVQAARCPWRYLIRKKRGGKSIIKFVSHRQAACFCFILSVCVWRPPDCPPASYSTHTFHHWPVSNAITGRLLHAFMKYSNGSVSYCALIIPCKDRKRRRGPETDGQTENNNERRPYFLRCGQKLFSNYPKSFYSYFIFLQIL